MNADNSTIILVTLIAYKALLLGIGFWARGRTHDETDFFLGGRKLGPLVASISYAASSSSAWTLLGVSGAAFSQGLGAIWMLPGIVAGHIFAWFFLGNRIRKLSRQRELITLTDVVTLDLSEQQRRSAAIVASAITLFAFTFYVAAQFQGAGNAFAQSFGLQATPAIGLGAAIILIYTLLGGFWAVSITDTLQGLLMLAAAILLPIAGLWSVGGISELWAGLQEQSTHLTTWSAQHTGLAGLGFIFGLLGVGLGVFGQPHLVNRFMALADHNALRKARIMAITWFSVVLAGMLIVGWCARVLLGTTVESEKAFFALSDTLLPALVTGVLTAAVLSAIMSTADSQLLVAASSASYDLRKGDHRARNTLVSSRLAIVAICAVAALIAIFIPASIFGRVLFAWSGLGAAFGPLIIARAIGRPVAFLAIPIAMLIGFLGTAFFYALPGTLADAGERFIPFLAAMAVVWLWPTKNQ